MSACLCGGRLTVNTPQDVKDDLSIDVFDEIFTLSGISSDYATDYKKGLWATYRYRMIGNCDLEYWEQCFADRLSIVAAKYDAMMSKFEETDVTDLGDSEYRMTTARSAIEGTDGDKTTVESETFPITPVDESDRYLTSRATTTHAPSNQDDTTFKGYSGLNAATFAQMMDDYDSPLYRFLMEFDRFFINRWSL